MRTLRLLLPGCALLLAVGCATAPQPSTTDTVTRREIAVWQSAKDGQPEAFAARLDPVYSGVYADGVHSRAVEQEAVRREHLRSFAMGSIAARQLDARTQTLTYKVTVNGDYNGTDFSGDYWAASLWRHSGGKWLLLLHTEAKCP